jgi:predicted Fe-S protein YdhL (DUF1289 family)
MTPDERRAATRKARETRWGNVTPEARREVMRQMRDASVQRAALVRRLLAEHQQTGGTAA